MPEYNKRGFYRIFTSLYLSVNGSKLVKQEANISASGIAFALNKQKHNLAFINNEIGIDFSINGTEFLGIKSVVVRIDKNPDRLLIGCSFSNIKTEDQLILDSIIKKIDGYQADDVEGKIRHLRVYAPEIAREIEENQIISTLVSNKKDFK